MRVGERRSAPVWHGQPHLERDVSATGVPRQLPHASREPAHVKRAPRAPLSQCGQGMVWIPPPEQPSNLRGAVDPAAPGEVVPGVAPVARRVEAGREEPPGTRVYVD